jgi:hypothetical protein
MCQKQVTLMNAFQHNYHEEKSYFIITGIILISTASQAQRSNGKIKQEV